VLRRRFWAILAPVQDRHGSEHVDDLFMRDSAAGILGHVLDDPSPGWVWAALVCLQRPDVAAKDLFQELWSRIGW
jgi:hypothetical protein